MRTLDVRSDTLQATSMDKTIIGICTCFRPQMLEDALNGVLNLDFPAGRITILVIDNDKDASALEAVETFKARSGREVLYLVEPARGLVNARNRLLDEAIATGARFLAGFDDDAVPESQWLSQLHKAREKTVCDAVAGPQINAFTEDPGAQQNYEGELLESFATYNYLLDLDFLRRHSIHFDPAFNFTGGEDRDFSMTMQKAGARIIWTNRAIVREPAHPGRQKLSTRLRRQMIHGQAVMHLRIKHQKQRSRAAWLASVALKTLTRALSIAPHALLGRRALIRRVLLASDYVGRLLFLFNVRLDYYRKIDGE